jgi:hypothetical protein
MNAWATIDRMIGVFTGEPAAPAALMFGISLRRAGRKLARHKSLRIYPALMLSAF